MKAIRTKSMLLIICVLFGYFLISSPLNKVNAATQNEDVAQAYYRSQYRYSSTPITFVIGSANLLCPQANKSAAAEYAVQ